MTKRTKEDRLEEKLQRRAKLDAQIERLDNPLQPMLRRITSAADDAIQECNDADRCILIQRALTDMQVAMRGYRTPEADNGQ